jgi:hypothetical protein
MIAYNVSIVMPVHRGDDAYFRSQAARSEEEPYFASTACLMAVRLTEGRYAHGSFSVSHLHNWRPCGKFSS